MSLVEVVRARSRAGELALLASTLGNALAAENHAGRGGLSMACHISNISCFSISRIRGNLAWSGSEDVRIKPNQRPEREWEWVYLGRHY